MSVVRRDAVRVVVPATSGNVGPGFDCAGLALDVFDQLVAMATDDEGVLVEVEGEGAGQVPLDESHLVVRSMSLAFDWLGVRPRGFVLRCINAIPQGRGLGSSAAAIIGGMVLARAMIDDGPERMTDSDVLQLALTLESHPDNLAPALFGGFTIAWLEDDGFGDVVRLDVHPGVTPVIAVPAIEVRTEAARALLPTHVDLRDAVVNLSRASLLVHAITTDPARLLPATVDRLHQNPRRSAYPDSLALVDRLREVGIPAVISGAGPTVLAVTGSVDDIARHVPDGWLVRDVQVAVSGAREVILPPSS